MAGRRKLEDRNTRSLLKMSNGKSYAITLPIEIIRAFNWEKRQKLELSFDEQKKTITISDWKK